MIAGPVYFRSMWSTERCMGNLKGHVHTRSHVEGSIAEGYLFQESLTFRSRYLDGETLFNRGGRNDGDLDMEIASATPFFCNSGRGLAGKCQVMLDYKTWLQAHKYVLFNYDHIEPYLNKHINYLSTIGLQSKREINHLHYETFHEWFKLHVAEMGDEAPQEIKILAKEPNMVVLKYSSYKLNGIDFHTQSYDEGRPVQGSGVALIAQTTSFQKGNGDNTSVRNKAYYGIIKEILELNYQHEGKVVLLKCDWVDNRVEDKWVKTDQFGITSVNFKHIFNTGEKMSDEPFILASQATQVYYVEDPIDVEWSTVVIPSYYDIRYSEADELGYAPRRDEVFIRTHTLKKGPNKGQHVPEAAPIISELIRAANVHPDWKEKSLKEGDLFARVVGMKEPRGRVRVLGLGPTPQDVGTPDTRGKVSTRVLVEMVARREAEHRMSTLEEQMQQMQQQMNKMQEIMAASQGGHNLEAPSSQHGSNSRQNSIDEIDGEYGDEEDGEDDNVQRRKFVANPRNCSTQQDESLIGMDVLLYAWTGPETPVAKATVLSVDPDTTVGGEPLGPGTYEVIVNVAIKRDTILPYQYEDLLYIRDAVTRSIAWPSSKMKPYKPAVSGSSRH